MLAVNLRCELNSYEPLFSVKLSPVMPNPEDQVQKTRLSEPAVADGAVADEPVIAAAALPREVGGGAGPEPTRFGDWELRGRCIDF